ncbi:MAG: KAP family P-loop NTPase fold protein [Promethearchaeota archaeon]
MKSGLIKPIEERILDPDPKKSQKDDLYNFSSTVKLIKRYLENCRSPNTVGIFGSWGSGKSTLKNFLIEEIINDEKSKIIPIDFNCWHYEQEEGILSPLVATLIKNAGYKGKEREKIISLITFSILNIGLKILTSNLASLNDVLPDDNQIINLFDKYSKYNDKVEKIKKDFGSLVKKIIKKNKDGEKQKLVIFLDELDRCNPENTVKLLESIKNYFDVKDCVFVILVDDEILSSYINKKYKETKINGHLYLEKIINTKFSVPLVPQKKLNQIFKNHSILNFFTLTEKGEFDTNLFPRICNPRKIYKIFEKIKLIEEIKFDDISYSNKFKSLSDKDRQVKIALVIILNEVYPNIYNDLNKWDKKLLDKIKMKVQEFFKEIHRGKDELKNFIDYDEEELNFLNYIFDSFKDFDVFYEIDKILKIKKII